ncbi:MAG: ABC transporter ATP-binding protein [Elusimicrobia bacterium]|jgi:putative ABC transport system ATP-binding protein|nr:ABC transporter ATP-binding protein [Elusimicrobiota bacterium]
MALIELKDMYKKFPMGKNEFTALKEINLEFEKGEFAGLVGPSGSGKTTMLNILGSLDTPSEGSARVLDNNIGDLSGKAAAQLRKKHMGFIFQTYNLLPVYTVYENIEFPLLILKMSREERKKKVADALDWVGLTDKKKSRPAQLSGGESQRVAVARAIVKRPDLVLADEPTANLDDENAYNVLEMMVKLNEELNTTFIFATHDHKVIKYLKRKINLIDGKITEDMADLPGVKG